MEYSQIILEMLERVKILENKVKVLESKIEESMPAQQQNVQLDRISAKYRSLAEYLFLSNKTRVILTYSEIEEILGFKLPDTARKFKRSYWANTSTHTYASSWMAVGYKAHVDIDNDAVTFVKNLIEQR